MQEERDAVEIRRLAAAHGDGQPRVGELVNKEIVRRPDGPGADRERD
jgi:hypothetical protein